jgi:hypothetical protein
MAEIECEAPPSIAAFAEVTEREIREMRAAKGKA